MSAWNLLKKLVGPSDQLPIDLPGTETAQIPHGRRRRLVPIVVLAGAVVLVMGVSAAALAGHKAPRVVASTTLAKRGADSTTYRTKTSVDSISTTTVGATTTVPPITTTIHVVPPTSTVPVTSTPTTQAPPTTEAATANLRISPPVADFPSTPPPYWPMPIVHVTITNTGGAAVSFIVVHPVGVYSVPSNTCANLAPGQSCGADVQFCPTSPGHYVNVLSVTGQGAITNSPLQASATLDGTAT